MSASQSALRDVLRALRERDRRAAPPFARVIAQAPRMPRRHRTWWPAAALVAAAAGVVLWLRAPVVTEAPPPTWVDWRSPTAALLLQDSVIAGTDRFVSPTRSLQSRSGELR